MGDRYAELASVLARVRNRWRRLVLLRTWAMASTIAGMIVALALFTNRFADQDGRLTILLWAFAVLSAVLVGGIMMVLALTRVPGDDQVARFIEERTPDLDDVLVTAVAEGQRVPPHPMAATVIAAAAERMRKIDPRSLIAPRLIRIAAMGAVLGTMTLAVAIELSLPAAKHAAQVFALYAFPKRVDFDVQPGDAKVRAGDTVTIVARLAGASGDIVPILRVDEGDGSRELSMARRADAFTASLERIERGFRYTVVVGGATSREYAITVVRPPRVDRIDLRYEFPPAFHLAPRVEKDGGDIYAPAGTRVHLSIRADKPIAQASLQITGGKTLALQSVGDVVEGELTISDEGSYRVALSDADGLHNPGDTEYFIRTIEDRPPDVRIVRPAADRQVSPIEEVPVEARADDDYGVASLDLVYSVRGRDEKVLPFSDMTAGTTVNGTRTLYLEDLDVKPGDFVTYYARARDISRGKRSSEARSDIFFLEVKPFDEEFVAAESQGSGAGGGDSASLDELVAAQKDVITATWRLDRRARDAGGRSADDIHAVARAQGEVRRRAAGIAAQQQRSIDVRRRRGAGTSQPRVENTGDQPLLKAMDAMAGAQEQLDALKTSEALPHEMTALNELLRAQAEIRRREVQRQQANGTGSGGSNRQTQDLSSLFDRELQRQQQTNYETPNSTETREQKRSGNDVLDKIRDLARRQEALNHDQEQAATSPEEMRRQLERLTREQSELRQQAEELSRQLEQQQRSNQAASSRQSSQQRGQQSSGSGSAGQSSADEQARRAVQQAAEEMRNAASDLRRQKPGDARASGGRALERLRDVEQRLGDAQPDDRRRAAGELQLEARQLADAQRQLASSPSTSPGASPSTSPRAGGSPQDSAAASADEARRRSAEQERLADRAQRLEEGVKQLAGAQGNEKNRAALADAAREVDREKLSERMRNAARAGQRNTPTDRNDLQEIARALDRVGDRLASANGDSDETRRLSEQLAKARELRDRLARVDQQLADARRQGEQQGRSGGGRESQSGSGRESQQATGTGRGQGTKPGDAQQPSASASSGDQPSGQGAGSSTSGSWQEAQQLLEHVQRDQQLGLSPDDTRGFNPGRSAPGTEPWKQDFAKWEELKKQVGAALEKLETTAASRLREQQAKDRLAAGAAQTVPDAYRSLVEQYYKALADKNAPKR